MCGGHIVGSSVSELTLKFLHANLPNFFPLIALCPSPPPLGTSAGQDNLIKYEHTLFDPDLLQCQYIKSIVFMLQSFCSQRY